MTTLGPFDLDPCTQTFRPYDTAARHICEDAGECGLASKWEGRVWLNPPYGKAIPKWLGKLADHGNGIALVFSRTETGWGQAMIGRADAVNFLKGRIAFIRKDGKPSTNAGTGSMLLAFGRENVEAIKRLPGVIFMQNYPSQSQTTSRRLDAFVRAATNFLETHGFHLRERNIWSHKTRPEVFENPVEGAYIIWQQEHAKLYPLHTADLETGLVLPQERFDKYDLHRVGICTLTP